MFLRESDYFRVALVFSLVSLKSLEFKSIYSIADYPSFYSRLGLRGVFSLMEGLISIGLVLGGCCGSNYLISSSTLIGMLELGGMTDNRNLSRLMTCVLELSDTLMPIFQFSSIDK
jgi:hypothetical protein